MLHFINSIEPEAWVGLAGLLAGIGGAIAAVLKGARKTPVEVGHPPPEVDRTEYVLREVRKANACIAQIDERVAEIDRRTEEILIDTQVLRAK